MHKRKGEKKHSASEGRKFDLEYEIIATEAANRFFSSLDSKDMKAYKCRGCKKVIYPPADFCPFCGRKIEKSDAVKISNDAKVFSQTVIHYTVPLMSDFKQNFALIAFRIPQTDTYVIVPSKNTGIYLGDRVKIFVKSKDKKHDMSDIELEKL